MPPYSRSKTKSRLRRGRRYRRRKYSKGTYKGRVNQGTVYYFKRKVKYTDILFATAGTSDGMSFQLSDLPGYTDFTNMFDQYQISRIKVELMPMNQQTVLIADPSPNSLVGFPYMTTAIDYDDASTPASENELLQYQNARHFLATKYHKRYFRPKVALASYSGAFTSYASKGGQWIDTDSTSVQHYGFKWLLQSCSANINNHVAYEIIATFYIKCKMVI